MNFLFSKPRATVYYNNQPPPENQNQSIQFMKRFRQLQPNTAIQNKVTIIEAPAKPEGKKMLWGEPIWFFFHTMAEKVNPDSFQIIRVRFFQIVSNICKNLPCPICAEHATQYLNNTNLNTVQTKEQLIDFFFTFHNSVNMRKGVPLFPKEQLRDKYSKANIVNIINNFIVNFNDKSFNVRMLADDFQRKQIIKDIKAWLTDNLQYFNS
jgi:hypothetical protein